MRFRLNGRLWTPQQDMQDRVPTMLCRVPVGDGETCGKEFYAGEERQFQKHTGDCAREHMEEIRGASPRTGIFDPEAWDPEVKAHMREVGRRMRREGRLEVHPSERAGF